MNAAPTTERPAAPAPEAGPNTAVRITPAATVQHGALLTWRSLLKIKRNPEEILGLTFMPIMFAGLFVFVFGNSISDGGWQAYRDFIIPGIAAQSVIFATVGTGVTLNTDIEKGIFDRFRALPVARSAPLIGAILGDMARYVLTVTMVLIVGFAIGFRPESGLAGLVAATAVVMLFAFGLCWLSAFMGLLLRTPMAVNIFGSIWMFPLTFASSTFVNPDNMPSWMSAFATVNPVTHVVDAMRGLLLEGPVAEPLLWTLGWTLVLTAVFFPLATRAYRKRA